MFLTTPTYADVLDRRNRSRVRLDPGSRSACALDPYGQDAPEPVKDLSQHHHFRAPLGEPFGALDFLELLRLGPLWIVDQSFDEVAVARNVVDQIEQLRPSPLSPQDANVDPSEPKVSFNRLAESL